MPFTPSHAVIALPFLRTPLIPDAIAIGAMTPDMALFTRGIGPSYAFTHAFANVVWTSLVALVLFAIWRMLLRPAFGELVPMWVARRLPAEWATSGIRGLGRAYPLLLALSLALGVMSHIAWDLFTHEGRWGTILLPALDESWGPLPGYKWLQHGSSVLGLAVIAAWALVWLRRREAQPDAAQTTARWVRVGWWLSLPAMLIGAWLIGIALFGPFTAEFTLQHLGYRVLPPACGVWGALTLILCVVLALRRRAHQRG